VPDNLKSGVAKSLKYEPDLNPTYTEMAEHYGCAVLPARPRKPRDKAKVETGVLIAQRWILAILRTAPSTAWLSLIPPSVNAWSGLNTRLLRQANKSRQELFETFDRPNALSLPQRAYEYAEWYRLRCTWTITSR